MNGYGEFIDEQGAYDIFNYLKFYVDNVQCRTECSDDEDIQFADYDINQFDFDYNLIGKILSDKELESIQQEFGEKLGINLCMFNAYTLSMYINKEIRNSFFVRLKPTVDDIRKDVNKFVKIDELCGSEVKEAMLKALETIEPKNNYERHDFVCIDKIVDIIVLQHFFIVNMANFMKKRFPDAKRRHNCCLVSEVEQRLILRMMYHVGLAPDGLSTSRFRQIAMYKPNVKFEFSKFPGIDQRVPIGFLKYVDWSKKKIDWEHLDELKTGETVKM